ncbi:DUF4422 domain-containing protein, partial [Campylobacter jejuni]|nr:DUF4422 domain-containing protein [Campylobacter jejuni]
MNVRILVLYHKPSKLIKNNKYVPMCVGKKIFLSNSKDGFVDKRYFYWMNENTIGDDTGDNISDKNRFINEFSAIYWAWKNYNQLENPDYIGFMHYRRHFIFNPNNKKLASREFSNYCLTYSFINREYEELIKPDHFNFSEYDLVIPEFLNFAKCSNKRYSNILESYLTYAGRDDMLLKIEEVVLKHPKLYKYKNFIKKFYQKEGFYPFNMFIMKKNLFFEYAEFIFTIFNEIWSDDIENSLKLRGLHYQRELAWALEIATSFFIQYQINNVKKRYKELPISFVKNTDLEIELITPVQRENPIGICLIYNKLIISYLSVVLQSLIENSDEKSVYDICILCIECIDKTDEKKLISLVKDKSYISLRFFMLDNFSCIRENDSFFKSKNSLNFDNYKI